MAKRECKEKRKDGKPCTAAPLKGRDVCLAHADADTRESAGFVADNGKGGRPRVPTATEVMRELVEEHVAVILGPHFRVLGYDVEIAEQKDGSRKVGLVPLKDGGAKLFGESREGVVKMSSFEDLGAQLAAAEKILDRVFGRPKQATELTGPGGGPIEADIIGVPTESQFQQGVAEILAAAGAVGDDD